MRFSTSPLPTLSISRNNSPGIQIDFPGSTWECTPGSSGQDSAEQWMGVCGIASYLPSFLVVTDVMHGTRKTKRANLRSNINYILPGNGNGVICIQTDMQTSAHTHAQTTHACTHEHHKYTCILKVHTHIHFILFPLASILCCHFRVVTTYGKWQSAVMTTK